MPDPQTTKPEWLLIGAKLAFYLYGTLAFACYVWRGA
jgi:hypothetical protein